MKFLKNLLITTLFYYLHIMNVVIIGNGVAGVTVASKLRTLDPDVSITIYTEENYGYYSRIGLPGLISGEKTVENIVMRKAEWYDGKGIKLHLSTRVEAVDAKRKTVTLEGGDVVSFNKLCISTGAHNWMPPVDNSGIDGVFTLRTIDDALDIKQYVVDKKRVVCVGGGVLGLEASRKLKKLGLDVTIVEYFPRLLSRQLCSSSSRIFNEKINDLGLKTILGTTAAAIIGRDAVEGVRLKDGRELPADALLVSAGIRPNVEFLKGSGLMVDRCLVVNEYLQTSHPDIYAAGDVAEFQGKSWGIIPAALEQGAIVARHLLGLETEPYAGTTPSNTLKIMDFDLMSTGTAILGDADDECKVFIAKDEEKGIFKKFVVKDDKLIGAILLESKTDEKFVKKNLNKKVSLDEIHTRLQL
ncbi:MAG: NAD(P)/FAD-dependent oxidoreductase [Promethearchaeota archaeon]